MLSIGRWLVLYLVLVNLMTDIQDAKWGLNHGIRTKINSPVDKSKANAALTLIHVYSILLRAAVAWRDVEESTRFHHATFILVLVAQRHLFQTNGRTRPYQGAALHFVCKSSSTSTHPFYNGRYPL